MKTQVIYINGGVAKENFQSYYDFLQKLDFNPYEEKFENWNKTLGDFLGGDYEYFRVPFREREYADYEAWKIMFEKTFPFFYPEIVLIAGSLGGAFILKYLTENSFPSKIKKMILLAPVLNDSQSEKLGSFTFDKTKIPSIESKIETIVIYHSLDDEIVPISDSKELLGFLPKATFREFSDKGHFYLQARLPEIENDIKNEAITF